MGSLVSGKEGVFLKSDVSILTQNVLAESQNGPIKLRTPTIHAANFFLTTNQEVFLPYDHPTDHALKGISWAGPSPSPYPFNYFVQADLSFEKSSTNNQFFIIFGAKEVTFHAKS